jgi:hypothetical protein
MFLFYEIPSKLLSENTTVMDKMFRHNPVVKPIVQVHITTSYPPSSPLLHPPPPLSLPLT